MQHKSLWLRQQYSISGESFWIFISYFLSVLLQKQLFSADHFDHQLEKKAGKLSDDLFTPFLQYLRTVPHPYREEKVSSDRKPWVKRPAKLEIR